jgi:hypothetical protein
LFFSNDLTCKDTLYKTALHDTSYLQNYYICYFLKQRTGEAVKAVTENGNLWIFFRANGFNWEQSNRYILRLLQTDDTLNLAGFEGHPGY